MTTTLFDFLKNFNADAYEIALQIEDEVTTSPASIKTYATTFLECIVDDMLLKSGNSSKVSPLANFTPKVKKLSMFGVIKYSFETQLINAYKLRNTAHYSLKKTADEDKRLALELYEKLFHIAWRYFQEFGGNEYGYIGKPKYVPPFRENSEKELVEVPNIERMEKLFDQCIICGRKNNSHYHNLCNDCNNKIEHVEDVINLNNHFEGQFNKKNIVDLGYSKPYSDALIRELLNEKLILKVDKSYSFNDDLFKDYLAEIEMYGEIELVLSEFASGKLSLKDIKSSDYYKKGKRSIKPYIQLYNIVNDVVFKEFLSQLDLGIEIEEIMKDTTITTDEIDSWYSNQLNLLERGVKNKDFINFNKILIDNYINLRSQGKSKKYIISANYLPSGIVDFWQNTHIRDLDYFKKELDDTLMDLILKEINDNKTKEEFLDDVEISESKFEELLDNYDDFREIYIRDYIDKRRNKFIYYLNENNLINSTKKANLSESEVEEWLNEGQKDFEFNVDSKLAEFYIETIKRLMNLYVKYRLDGLSKKEAAEKINQSTVTINKWLNRNDNEIFIDFKKQMDDIAISIMINGFKNGLKLSEVANIANVSLNKLNEFISEGEKGNDKYVELFEVYKNEYVLKQLDLFLDNLKTSKYKKALKSSLLSEDDLNKFYIKGLEGDGSFKKFSDEYFDYKVEIYAKELINKNKTPSKASRNANLLDEDFKYHTDEIDNIILEKKVQIALPYLKEDVYAKDIADKIDISIEEFFDWYVKGYNGDERFKQFSEDYWLYRMENAIEEFQIMFNKGISEKFFLKELLRKEIIPEYEFWKSLGVFTFPDDVVSDEKALEIFENSIIEELIPFIQLNDLTNEEIEIDDDAEIDYALSDFLAKRGL